MIKRGVMRDFFEVQANYSFDVLTNYLGYYDDKIKKFDWYANVDFVEWLIHSHTLESHSGDISDVTIMLPGHPPPPRTIFIQLFCMNRLSLL